MEHAKHTHPSWNLERQALLLFEKLEFRSSGAKRAQAMLASSQCLVQILSEAWSWYEARHRDQGNRTEDLEINPATYSQWIPSKVARV